MTTNQSMIQSHPLEVLAHCLLNAHKTYTSLLEASASRELCKEAGKTVRYLAGCLSEIGQLESTADDELDPDDEMFEGLEADDKNSV